MTLATYQWTVEQYHQAVDAGLFADESVELLRGNLVVMAPEREPHAFFTRSTGNYLRRALGDLAEISEAHPITLSNNSEPQPDIAIIQPLGREYLAHHPYPENIFWLIECSQATLSKDLTEKKEIYAEAGIQEYWIIDLQSQQLIVFRDLRDGTYMTEQTLTTGFITPLSFPMINLAVPTLLQNIEAA